MLILTCTRVFAGTSEIQAHDHAADAHEAAFGLLLEHSHDLSDEGDPTNTHFHCHNGCAHAPMLPPSNPVLVSSVASTFATVELTLPTSSPVFAHFRPPRV